MTYIEEEEGKEEFDESLESFPLSTWSQDSGLTALSFDSLQDSEGKKVFIGHNTLSNSQISKTTRWVSLLQNSNCTTNIGEKKKKEKGEI